MAVRTFSQAVDNLYTTTWKHMKKEAVDNIFDATPFWAWMRDKGRLQTKVGGRQIEEALVYAKNDNVQWIGKGGTVPLNDYEFLTDAVYEWKYLTASMVRFGTDDQKNRGKTKIMDLMTNKMTNTKMSLEDTLETVLFAGAAAGNEIDGLQQLVADDGISDSGTVGGINPTTYSWWQNKNQTMTGSSFSTNGVGEMRTMVNNVSQNKQNDRPDIIVTGQTVYEYYEEEGLEKLDLASTRLVELGFDNQTFKGIPMVWSPSCGLRMYFLNTKYLNFTYDPGMFFDMTEWKPIPEQVNDRAAQIATACSFTTNRRRTQGVIHTIDLA
jgi:hypothetical protein